MNQQQALTPTITAEIVGITAVSLRRWCDYHAKHLSPEAKPPSGQARRFSGRDIEVLKHVKVLRDQGFSVTNINQQLALLTFAEIDNPVDDTPSPIAPQSPLVAQDNAHQAPGLIVVVDDLQKRLALLEASTKAMEHSRREPVYYIAVGFLVACGLFILLIGLAVLYGGYR